MNKLRLLATEASDLEVIAGAIQDSIFQIGQTRLDPKGRYFTLRLSRYMRELKKPHRIESGLRFDGVLKVRSTGVDLAKSEAFAVILGLSFEPSELPSGTFELTLAGGGVIQIQAESIDLTLADVGEPTPTKRVPEHHD